MLLGYRSYLEVPEAFRHAGGNRMRWHCRESWRWTGSRGDLHWRGADGGALPAVSRSARVGRQSEQATQEALQWIEEAHSGWHSGQHAGVDGQHLCEYSSSERRQAERFVWKYGTVWATLGQSLERESLVGGSARGHSHEWRRWPDSVVSYRWVWKEHHLHGESIAWMGESQPALRPSPILAEHCSLQGNLTNRSWWKAQDLVEIFGLAWYNLTREEESEVVRYIKSHSQQVLLVANALVEDLVDKDSLLNPEHRGFPRTPLPPEVRDCRLHRRQNQAVHPSVFGTDSGEDIRAADAASD